MTKNSQVFGWDEEPADERPSEFMNSTSYSVLSGYHVPSDLTKRPRPRRRSGSSSTLFWIGMLMVVGVVAMIAVARYLRGG